MCLVLGTACSACRPSRSCRPPSPPQCTPELRWNVWDVALRAYRKRHERRVELDLGPDDLPVEGDVWSNRRSAGPLGGIC